LSSVAVNGPLDKTAQTVIYDVINDITVLLVLDFNKCVKLKKSTDVISLCYWLASCRNRRPTLYSGLQFLHRSSN